MFIFEPTLNPAPLLNSPLLYAILYPLWQLVVFLPLLAALRVRATDPETERLEWAAYVLFLLLLSPVPSTYHFVVMVFSIVLLVDVLLARKQCCAAALAVTLYCLISIVEFLPVSGGSGFSGITLLAFTRLWIELLFGALCLFCLWPDHATRKLLKADLPRAVSLWAVFVIAWTTGMISYRRHFAYLNEDISRRMPAPVRTYLATALRPTSSGYVFTGMLPDGYRVLDQAGREVWWQRRSLVDQFSAAAAGGTSVLLLEVADATGSKIVRIPFSMKSSRDSEGAAMLIPDAESPAVSADGRTVAFIRELKGKGTLWMVRFEDREGAAESAPIQAAAKAYDVRDVTFAPSGRLMFSAQVNDRISIFNVTPGSQPGMFSSPDEDAESPAVSPDERFVAFLKLVHNRWQLGYTDVAGRQEKLLTFGDCNAYSPTWIGPRTIAYATDCGRGLGLSALASIDIGHAQDSPDALEVPGLNKK